VITLWSGERFRTDKKKKREKVAIRKTEELNFALVKALADGKTQIERPLPFWK
jgi:hypothetical protein